MCLLKKDERTAILFLFRRSVDESLLALSIFVKVFYIEKVNRYGLIVC
jgi:hypothetical protein